LEHLGFDFARAQACRHKAWEVMDGLTLKQITVQTLEDVASITGSDFHTVHRVDLHKELLRLALDATTDNHSAPPVKIQYGSPIANVNSLNGQVYLTDGTIHTADLVVAADGIHSTVRECVVPPDSNTSNKAIETGMSAFRFLLPTEALMARPEIRDAMRMKAGGSALLADTSRVSGVQHMIWYGCRGCVFPFQYTLARITDEATESKSRTSLASIKQKRQSKARVTQSQTCCKNSAISIPLSQS
jgi:salicylate hydroxylase